jgi:hypothetical protein
MVRLQIAQRRGCRRELLEELKVPFCRLERCGQGYVKSAIGRAVHRDICLQYLLLRRWGLIAMLPPPQAVRVTRATRLTTNARDFIASIVVNLSWPEKMLKALRQEMAIL